LNGACSSDPLLVLIPRIASVNLHLIAVVLDTIGQVQAFIAINLKIETADSPQLVGRSSNTILNLDNRAVGIRSCSKTFARVSVGMDNLVGTGRGRSWRTSRC
jgi:hypothetical protein